MRDWLVLDIATAPIPEARRYLDGTIKAPKHYKKPDVIADYIREETERQIAEAAVDIDLCRLTAVGLIRVTVSGDVLVESTVHLSKTEALEKAVLTTVAAMTEECSTVTYGGLRFDLPVLMRRAAYLGVDFPAINLDRYRSPHVDLCELMSFGDKQKTRPLGWYVKRLGWVDLEKPLSGEEEAKVHETGKWEALAASVTHDIVAIKRLAQWTGVMR